MRLYVGQANFRGAIARYAQRFDMVEVTAESGRLPRRSTLEGWRNAVPDEFVFSLALPHAVASLESNTAPEALVGFAEQVAGTLGSQWWILKTPASVTPGAANRRRLAALVERLKRDERRVAWEPRGLWSEDELTDIAEELELTLVRDGTRETLPDSDVVYTRVRALGTGASVGLGAVELLAEQLEGREEAFVVIEGEGAVRARQILNQSLDIEEPAEEPE